MIDEFNAFLHVEWQEGEPTVGVEARKRVNVLALEKRYAFWPRDFRLWIAIHECTHRAQLLPRVIGRGLSSTRSSMTSSCQISAVRSAAVLTTLLPPRSEPGGG